MRVDFFFPPDDRFFKTGSKRSICRALMSIYVIVSSTWCWSFIAPKCSSSECTEIYKIPLRMSHFIRKIDFRVFSKNSMLSVIKTNNRILFKYYIYEE